MSVTYNPTLRYQCSRCMEVYHHEYEAEECCQPEVYTVFVCPTCDELYDSQTESLDCCDTDMADLIRATPLELEAAGQLRLIP